VCAEVRIHEAGGFPELAPVPHVVQPSREGALGPLILVFRVVRVVGAGELYQVIVGIAVLPREVDVMEVPVHRQRVAGEKDWRSIEARPRLQDRPDKAGSSAHTPRKWWPSMRSGLSAERK